MDSHSSRPVVTNWLKQPTRIQREPRHWIPIWSCSEWGLPCHELLPVMRCALTAPFHPYRPIVETTRLGGLLSAALSVGFRPPGVTWHSALWSPDFPLAPKGQRLSGELAQHLTLTNAPRASNDHSRMREIPTLL